MLCHAVLCCAVQYDLDDNGKLDSNEFVKMLQSLGTDVSKDEADAAMEVSRAEPACLPACVPAQLCLKVGKRTTSKAAVCVALRLRVGVLRHSHRQCAALCAFLRQKMELVLLRLQGR